MLLNELTELQRNILKSYTEIQFSKYYLKSWYGSIFFFNNTLNNKDLTANLITIISK